MNPFLKFICDEMNTMEWAKRQESGFTCALTRLYGRG
ncbi:MAG: hypothetical protein ACI84R_001440, partial [Candidatus Azotimanducaceae bacterium]